MSRKQLSILRSYFTQDSPVFVTNLNRDHGMTQVDLLPDIRRKAMKLEASRKSHKSWISAKRSPDSLRSQDIIDRSTARTATFKFRVGSADDIGQLRQTDTLRPNRLSLSTSATCRTNESFKRTSADACGPLTDKRLPYAYGRTIRPSKKGYHPRILSATYKRLTKVKDRLESEVLQTGDIEVSNFSNKEVETLKDRRRFEYKIKNDNNATFRDSSRTLLRTRHRSHSSLAPSAMWKIPHHSSKSSDKTLKRTRHIGSYRADVKNPGTRHVRQTSRDRSISERISPIMRVTTSVLLDVPRNTEYKNYFLKLPLSKKTAESANTEHRDQRKWELHVTLPSADADWVNER